MDRLHHHPLHHRFQHPQQQHHRNHHPQQQPPQLQHHHQHHQHNQHPGLHQIDPQLQQSHHLSAAPHPTHHPLQPLQATSGASPSPSPAYHHPNLAPHQQHVGGAGGTLGQGRSSNPPPGSSGPPASSVQQYHTLAPHSPLQTHPPPKHQHQQQKPNPQLSATPSQPPMQSLPPPQQHAPQRNAPVPLRPMPPPSSVPANQQGQSAQVGIANNQMGANAAMPPQGAIGSGGRRVLPGGGVSGPASAGIGSAAGLSGITTTSSGRSSANTGITPGATSQITPVKDQDGKFPCPHCPKTYLHAKHLKRHLLRHTGDRPYQCVLCKDTFSRSDILKRHFQKCSIRRGNPTGATHLSHAHAHQQGKQGNNQNTSSGTSVSPPLSNAGVPSAQGSPTMGGKKKSTGKACDECVRLKVRCDLGNPCERCQSRGCECTYSRSTAPRRAGMKNDAGGIVPSPEFSDPSGQVPSYTEGFNFPPPTHPHTHMTHQGHQQQHTLPSSRPPQQRHLQAANSTLQQSRTSGNLPPSQGPATAAFYGNQPPQSQNEVDWTSFMQVGDTNFMDPFYLQSGGPTTGDSGTPATTASMDPSMQPSNGGMYSMLFTGGPAGVATMGGMMSGFSGWTNIAMHQIDPLQAKCDRLIAHCFPENPTRGLGPESPNQGVKRDSGRDEALKAWLTPDNVKHFVHLFFANFQGHFPLIHIPTFNITSIYDGLLLVIICIGAVYSMRGITVDQVRVLMDKTLFMIERNEQHRTTSGRMHDGRVGIRAPELEEIQAMILIHILSTWHGNHPQRDNSKRKFPRVIQLAREAGLFKPLTAENCGHLGPSIYHQLGCNETELPLPGSRSWNWLSWVEQEKRNRAMYAIYLLDCAFVIFFNAAPHIPIFDIKLTLPADDAPWEAPNSTDCANLLGLNGEELCKNNISGTRRVKQPEFIAAAKALLQCQLEFKPGLTNAYSKFILIHALHVHIWSSQKIILTPTEQASFSGNPVATDWKMEFIVGNDQNGGSGRGTPEGFLENSLNGQPMNEAAKFVRLTSYALEKWKRAWDADLVTQYPSQTSRIGFCRDAVPFYWLAKLFLARNRTTDWMHGGDDNQTVLKVKNMLRHVRSFITDDEGRPSIQGAVCAIDEGYGVDELTFDMKLLFKPIEEPERSPQPQSAGQESPWPGAVGVSGPQR